MSDGPVFVGRVDYEAALSWYMENDDGTEDALVNAINVALVGVREAKDETLHRIWPRPARRSHRFVTEWEEVEE